MAARSPEGSTTDLEALKERGCIVLQEKHRLLIAAAYIMHWCLPLVFLLWTMGLLYAWYFQNLGVQEHLTRYWVSNVTIGVVACVTIAYSYIKGNGKRVKALVLTADKALFEKFQDSNVGLVNLPDAKEIYAEKFMLMDGVRLYFYIHGDQPTHVYRFFDPTTVETLKKLCAANNIAFKFRRSIFSPPETAPLLMLMITTAYHCFL